MNDDHASVVRLSLTPEFLAIPEVADLAATIGHLHEVIDEYREVIDLHHADFRAVKQAVTRGLQAPTALDCPGQVGWARKALAEIDGIVR